MNVLQGAYIPGNLNQQWLEGLLVSDVALVGHGASLIPLLAQSLYWKPGYILRRQVILSLEEGWKSRYLGPDQGA